MKSRIFFLITAFFLPAIASAHEVYVLTPDEVKAGLATPPFNPFDVIVDNLGQFSFWAAIAFLIVGGVFVLSISKTLEHRLAKFFTHMRHYAPAVARITGGLAFLACAYYNALFGPELPLGAVFGAYAPLARIALTLVGLMILTGVWVRIGAVIAGVLFATAVARYGTYMITYTNYAGEIILLVTLGTRHLIERGIARFTFLILRVAFGTSLLFASFYAKFLHNDLALQVATLPLAGHAHTLASIFGFEPHFMVVGAGLVEIVIALFFILGIEIRFTALFLEFWLALSLWYFGEAVWPHLILIGIPIAFFLYGYDRYSLEGHFFKKGRYEPVL